MKTPPNFILVGPGKCGTSWIYEFMRAHPQICVSTAKETLFFEDYFHKGIDWYLRFFMPKDGQLAIGELSNTYFFSEEAAKRISDFDPGMRLIVTLRNPLKRTFSHYLFLKRNGSVACSFDEILFDEKFFLVKDDLLRRSLYHLHLCKYLKFFSLDSILILFLEDLKQDPLRYSERICKFLDVDTVSDAENLPEKVLSASKPRSILLAKAVKYVASTVRSAGFPEILTRVKQSSLTKVIYQTYGKDSYPKISDSARKYLIKYYSEDVKSLSGLLNMNLSHTWLS